ncbi:2,3-bisphosphoglycerate-independent phosphoglycerate mutase [Candidatus Fermentibacteria bacterium]|nr:2,3-bisphosphoglycerate-independent phosphoglycerate mutase [Candidatus Fermentibacteria bacterium]
MADRLPDSLAETTDSKILLAVLDGVGDVPSGELGGRTPLQVAESPNLDRLAREGALGQHIPIEPGISPGSGPAHLALFGYDPVESCVGRGVLAAMGIGFDLREGDLAARINFCTLADDGSVSDRRAGRISTEKCRQLVEVLSRASVPGVKTFVNPVKEHRACVVFRGDNLSDAVDDTDPGVVGRRPRPVRATAEGAERSVEVVDSFLRQALDLLEGRQPANGILMRGFSTYRPFPSMEERFRLDAAAAALYPMYRGVASLVGMDLLEAGNSLEEEVSAAREAASSGRTFVFLHHKPTDSSGEDGDEAAKIAAVEVFDGALPDLLQAGFDVICVTGDHSTPCPMKQHSWHPVPVLIHGGPQRSGGSDAFSEREALTGALGTFYARQLMSLLLASAGKLRRFGA